MPSRAPAAADASGDALLATSPQRLYAAWRSRDARFDGRLYIGVTSTGIYCRPVCKVRLPQRQNCRFFASAASAECAGFRPCLRCRPELAPGLSLMDSSRVLARQAALCIDTAIRAGQDVTLAALAARLGVTERHLRRIFQAAHGVAPIDYLTTRRLLQAKLLLTDTDWPVAQVALASGFASVRRFNATFAARYRLRPTDLRRGMAAPATPVTPAAPRRTRPAGAGDAAQDAGSLRLRLAYRPPYDQTALLRFFAQRALPGIEQVDAHGLSRTLSVVHEGRRLDGWIRCQFDARPTPALKRQPGSSGGPAHELTVHLAADLSPALGAVLQRVRLAFDLDADAQALDPVLRRLPKPGKAGTAAGTRLPGAFDPFETAVRIVLGQQVTVAAARTLTLRLVQRFGRLRVGFENGPHPGLQGFFPEADVLAQAAPDAIGALGIVRQRVGALQALARAVAEGRLPLDGSAPLDTTLDALCALPGIGEWTAQMIAMRVLAWPDAFPSSDVGVLKALGTRDPREAEALAEAWRPWRAYAVIRLWQTQESPT